MRTRTVATPLSLSSSDAGRRSAKEADTIRDQPSRARPAVPDVLEAGRVARDNRRKTGGSPRCEPASAASTIAGRTQIAAPRLIREATCTDEHLYRRARRPGLDGPGVSTHARFLGGLLMTRTLASALVADLAGYVAGSVVGAPAAGNDSTLAVHNGLTHRRPVLIVRCRTGCNLAAACIAAPVRACPSNRGDRGDFAANGALPARCATSSGRPCLR